MNLHGVVHPIEAVYPIMILEHAGHIVNTASLSVSLPLLAQLATST